MLQRYLDGLTSPELQSYLAAHENDDGKSFVLKHRDVRGIPAGIIADQLSGRQKARVKLPALYQTPGIVYPPSVNLEQCSSEQAARFKAAVLLRDRSHDSRPFNGADLTGGFGVDTYFMSMVCNSMDCTEVNEEILSIANHNHSKLGAKNIRHFAMTAEAFLQSTEKRFDFVFMDPSRRSGSRKVFRLSDCQPDPVRLLPLIFEKTDKLLLKTSPLLDLQQGIKELGGARKVYVVAVDDECKEVLFLCNPLPTGDPTIICVNHSTSDSVQEEFIFSLLEERNAESIFSDPLGYLYEPHAWILKAGAFKLAGNRFGLFKLQSSTHLYTSDQLVEGFPGRVFKIEACPDPRSMRAYFPEGRATAFVRNYPLSTDELKAKFKIRDGGSKFLIGFSGRKKKFLVVAARIR